MTTQPATMTEKTKMAKSDGVKDERSQDIENTRKLLTLLIRALVDSPAEVRIQAVVGSQAVIYEVHVAPDDVRRVIGRKGRTADALRELMTGMGGKAGCRFLLEILEPEG